MRLSLAPLLLATAQVAAFAPSSSSLSKVRKTTLRRNDGGLAMSSPGGGKKVLTEADVMAKSAANQKASGGAGGDDPAAPGTQDAPKIFTPATYDDFQSSLQLLEKRVKGGPGSLSLDEVERFEEETGRIVKEMREFMADPEGVGECIRKSHEGGSAVVVDAKSTAVKEPIASIPSKPSTIVEASTVASPSPAAVTSPPRVPPDYTDVAPNDDSVNFGLARGTANTYAIPGMDEMSPEEYRAKLQETVSAHQAYRRKQGLSQTGSKRIGNLGSNGYLDGLSGGGQKGKNNIVASSEKKFGGRWKKPEMKVDNVGVSDPSRSGVVSSLHQQQRNQQQQQEVQKNENKLNEVNVSKVKSGTREDDRDEAIFSSAHDGAKEETGKSDLGRGDTQSKEEQNDVVKTNSSKKEEFPQWLEDQNKMVRERLKARQLVEQKALPGFQTVDEDQPEVSSPPMQQPLKSTLEEHQGSSLREQTTTTEETGAPTNTEAEADDRGHEELKSSHPNVVANEMDESPILAMKQSKHSEEESRKSEWQQGSSEGGVEPSTQVTKAGGRFKQMQADQKLLQASLDEKRTPMTPSPTLSDTASAKKDWWSEQRQRQRPMPSSERKSSFFQVHVTGKKSGTPVTAITQASQRVSKESTTSFAHGDIENTQRPMRPATPTDGVTPGYFKVHSVGDLRKPSQSKQNIQVVTTDHRGPGDMKSRGKVLDSSLAATAQSLVETEKRLRPIPTTDQPDHLKVTSDHRSVGDVKNQASRSQSTLSSVGSLVQTEERIRPFPSSDMPEHAQFEDHRSVGDRKDPGFSRRSQQKNAAQAKKSLVDTESQIRPIASSNPPDYAQVKDRRSVGDTKDPKRLQHSQSVAGAKSLVETEERIRPVASSNKPEYAEVKDRRSVGDVKDPKRSHQHAAALVAKSLIEMEGSIRPRVSTSDAHAQVGDHRGPGDSNTLTNRLKRSSEASAVERASLIEAEERVRPTPSSTQFPNSQVGDHRDPGDTNALTRRESFTVPVAKSLIEMEGSIRPRVSTSDQSAYAQVGDHRGPGDSNTLTNRLNRSAEASSAETMSLSEAEERVRPTPSSTQFPNSQVGDHRGPGDTNALTRREYSTPVMGSAAESLSGAFSEQRIRPNPSPYQAHNTQVSDHRSVGDTRTLTRKVKTLSSTTLATTSISEEEQRQRPVASSSSQSQSQTFQVRDHRGPGDSRALTKKVQSSSSSISSTIGSPSFEGEHRQRPVPSGNKSKPAAASSQSIDSETANHSEDEQWWNEKTQRPIHSASEPSKEKHAKVQDSSVSPGQTSSDSPPCPSMLKSLLEEVEKRSVPSSGSKSKAGTTATKKPPIAAMQPSSLQSLVKEETPPAVIKANTTIHRPEPATKTSRLSSLLDEKRTRSKNKETRSPTNESGWWNERPKRPRGYVKHHQPMVTTYVNKNEPPRDYGNVNTAFKSMSEDANDVVNYTPRIEEDGDDSAAAEPQEY